MRFVAGVVIFRHPGVYPVSNLAFELWLTVDLRAPSITLTKAARARFDTLAAESIEAVFRRC